MSTKLARAREAAVGEADAAATAVAEAVTEAGAAADAVAEAADAIAATTVATGNEVLLAVACPAICLG